MSNTAAAQLIWEFHKAQLHLLTYTAIRRRIIGVSVTDLKMSKNGDVWI